MAVAAVPHSAVLNLQPWEIDMLTRKPLILAAVVAATVGGPRFQAKRMRTMTHCWAPSSGRASAPRLAIMFTAVMVPS
jgi:hypothetical protein